MRTALTLVTLSGAKAQTTNRCDDTVQDNCMVVDSQAAECKEFLSSDEQITNGLTGWERSGVAAAYIKCKEEGGRLMKVASLSDLARLGADAKYGGHLVALDDLIAQASFLSYDEPAGTDIWLDNEPSGGTERCAQVVSMPNSLGQQPPNSNVNYLVNDVDCEDNMRAFICEKHADTTLMACNHWMCPIVGGDVFVDQNLDTTGDMTTLADDVFSFHKLQIDDGSFTEADMTDGNDDGIHSGIVSGNTITIAGQGVDGADWIGKIYKATPEFCVQETLDAYCRYLGETDWEIVLNESADCEDRSFARFKDNEWGCYATLGSGDVTECVDNNGDVLVACPDVSDAADKTCATPEIHLEMKRLVDEVTECGCKRPDIIEFTAPAQSLIRCGSGCLPGWKWDRPSYANLCEEIGYTKHYGCKLDGVDTTAAGTAGTIVVQATTPSIASYELCAAECENDTAETCAGINWNSDTLDCELLTAHDEATQFFAPSTDLTCADDGSTDVWQAGRKCFEMSEVVDTHTRMMDDLTVRPYICEHCDQHEFTTHEGCTYTGSEILEADGGLHKHIMTYKDCVQKCKDANVAAAGTCGGVTYYTRHYSEAEDGTTGPMYCQLHGTIAADPVCASNQPYDEVRSGIPCTDEPICVNELCHTCSTTNPPRTKELDCRHSGTEIRVEAGVADFEACRTFCENEATCELFIYHTAETVHATRLAQDCELMSDDVAMSRVCDPTLTRGQISGRTCENEELCTMGCGDFDECNGDGGDNAASHNCDESSGQACSNTNGGFTCNHGAGSLIPSAAAGGAGGTWDGHAGGGDGSGVVIDGSGNLVIGGVTASIDGTNILLPNPSDAANPVLTGTVSADGDTITWSDGTTSGRTDTVTDDGTGTGTDDGTGTGTDDGTGTGTDDGTGTGTDDGTGTGTDNSAGSETGTDSGTGTDNSAGSETGGSSYTPGTSASATGDPHFMIRFPNAMNDICFDLDGPNGKVFNLVHDPETHLVINAEIVDHGFGKHHADRLSKIGVISPMGNKVIFTTTEITGHGPEGTVSLGYDSDDIYNFGDIDISIHNRAQFRHMGATFTVDGSVFELSIKGTKEQKDSIKFYIDSEAHTNHDLDGLLGFTLAHSYRVINDTTLMINNEQMEYQYDHFESCYRLTDESIQRKLAKHQLSEEYLLGVPFEVAFLDDTSPK